MWFDDPIHQVPSAALFLTFIDGAQMYGMKIKTKTGLDAVLHLAGGELRVVDEDHFVNRDVFVLDSPKISISSTRPCKEWKPRS